MLRTSFRIQLVTKIRFQGMLRRQPGTAASRWLTRTGQCSINVEILVLRRPSHVKILVKRVVRTGAIYNGGEGRVTGPTRQCSQKIADRNSGGSEVDDSMQMFTVN